MKCHTRMCIIIAALPKLNMCQERMRKHEMKKRLLTLLLAFSLLLSMCPVALAAEDGVRETDFFTDQTHADVNFSDMEYKHIDSEPILAEMDEIRELLADGANEKTVEESFNKVADQFVEIVSM